MNHQVRLIKHDLSFCGDLLYLHHRHGSWLKPACYSCHHYQSDIINNVTDFTHFNARGSIGYVTLTFELNIMPPTPDSLHTVRFPSHSKLHEYKLSNTYLSSCTYTNNHEVKTEPAANNSQAFKGFLNCVELPCSWVESKQTRLQKKPNAPAALLKLYEISAVSEGLCSVSKRQRQQRWPSGTPRFAGSIVMWQQSSFNPCPSAA